jgi:hypothetical protein
MRGHYKNDGSSKGFSFSQLKFDVYIMEYGGPIITERPAGPWPKLNLPEGLSVEGLFVGSQGFLD